MGLVVNSLEEAAAAVERMTEGEYRDYRKAVEQFAPALRNGYFTKKFLVEAMQAFYRRDAGRLPLPEKVNEAGESVFGKAVLKESYGGNLAFSWDFQGEADGLLIYDTTGTLLWNTQDFHQHYLLLKGQEKEKGVIIKAYVEILKGKLIIAQSQAVYLQEGSYASPKVSMVIPAYNAENYIARCIDTILAQSQPDVEIIVVNDGSADRTPEIIDWYAQRYENVVALHQKNSGVAAARNTGMMRAGGEYIGFVDNDDMIYPSMVERLYQSAKKNDCDVAITSVYLVSDNEYENLVRYPIVEDQAIATDQFFPTYCYGRELGVVVWNKIYRASLAKSREMPSIPYDDVAWTTWILSDADNICYLDDHSYEWDRRAQDSSQLAGWLRHSKEEMFEQRKRAILFFVERGNPEKMALLKEAAKAFLLRWENSYQNQDYGRLWQEIEEKY